jgi:hypothetical protein
VTNLVVRGTALRNFHEYEVQPEFLAETAQLFRQALRIADQNLPAFRHFGYVRPREVF